VNGARPATLGEAISAAIAAYNPLQPWDAVSNYDQSHWDDEAGRAAPAVAVATSPEQVYDALVIELRPMVGAPEDNQYAEERIHAAATAIWRWLQSERQR
jgi:hypothetical protein